MGVIVEDPLRFIPFPFPVQGAAVHALHAAADGGLLHRVQVQARRLASETTGRCSKPQRGRLEICVRGAIQEPPRHERGCGADLEPGAKESFQHESGPVKRVASLPKKPGPRRLDQAYIVYASAFPKSSSCEVHSRVWTLEVWMLIYRQYKLTS